MCSLRKCTIGSVKCDLTDVEFEKVELPVSQDHQELRQEVPGGVWVSRVLAGEEGLNYMCHTLESNVSIEFALESTVILNNV